MAESYPKGFRKHSGKKRNCWLQAIPPFPTVFFKRFVLQTRKNNGLFGNGIKKRGKGENSDNHHFPLLPQCFPTSNGNILSFLARLKLSSANACNLDELENCEVW